MYVCVYVGLLYVYMHTCTYYNMYVYMSLYIYMFCMFTYICMIVCMNVHAYESMYKTVVYITKPFPWLHVYSSDNSECIFILQGI